MKGHKHLAHEMISSAQTATTGYHDMDDFGQKPLSKQESLLRRGLVFLSMLILAYIYSNSLTAQQAANQRISVSQAVDFPNDI